MVELSLPGIEGTYDYLSIWPIKAPYCQCGRLGDVRVSDLDPAIQHKVKQ